MHSRCVPSGSLSRHYAFTASDGSVQKSSPLTENDIFAAATVWAYCLHIKARLPARGEYFVQHAQTSSGGWQLWEVPIGELLHKMTI